MEKQKKPRIHRQPIRAKTRVIYLDDDGIPFDREPSKRGAKQLTRSDVLELSKRYKLLLEYPDR